MGALGAAAGAKHASGSSRVLALGSSKSCYGHTEGTAGLTGVLLATSALGQAALPPIANLRNLNPYVSAALADWQGRLALAAAPSRQKAPAAHFADGRSSQPMAGTSSFGMSGVNAHALLSASGQGMAEAGSSSSAWQRAAYWPSPQRHLLLQQAAVRLGSSASRLLDCAADLSAPGLAWLRDHSVQGRPLLPGAALFEMAAAAVAASQPADGSLSMSAALVGLSIMAPCVLPADGSATSVAALRCSLDSRTGLLELQSSAGSRHLQGTAAALPAHPLLLQPAAAACSASTAAALLPRLALAEASGHNCAKVEMRRQDAAG